MKLYCTILVFILYTSVALGQTAQADSLKRLLGNTNTDTGKVLLLARLATTYQFFNSDSSMLLAKQALKLAKEKKYVIGEIRALNALGSMYRSRGEFPEALEIVMQSLRMSKSIGDSVGLANSLSTTGLVYSDLGEYRLAVNYISQIKDVKVLFSISPSYYAGVLSHLGNAYEKMNVLDSALLYQRWAYALTSQLSPRNAHSLIFGHLGFLQERLNNYDSALYYYRASLRNAILTKDVRNQGESQNRLGELFYKLKQPDSSIYYARRAFGANQQIENKNRLLVSTALLINLFKDKKNYDSALHYQEFLLALKDSVFGPEKFKQLQLLAINEQQRQYDLQTKQAQAKTRLQQIGFLSALSIFFLIALLLWRNNRQKQKANTLLQKQKAETEEQKMKAETTLEELKATQVQLIQREKMASLGELTAGIAHEIQNPLNFVNNFSEVNQELLVELKEEADKGNIDEVKAIANDVIDNEQKINHHGKRADAIVKGMLQHSRASTGKKEPTDINALADEYLRLSYHGLRAKDKDFNADFKTNFDESIDNVEVVPQDIGRVLLNLYNNAFYAVNEKKKHLNKAFEPTVEVTTKRTADSVEISVKDNGMGIPKNVLDKIYQPFFTTKPTGQGTGLGLSLSYDIVKAHGGELKVETKEGEGAEFIIELPC